MDGLSGSFSSGKARASYVSPLLLGTASLGHVNADRAGDVLQGLVAPILKAMVRLPCSSSKTFADMQMLPGSATCCRRTATFTPSP